MVDPLHSLGKEGMPMTTIRPTMTKKHFIALAQALADARPCSPQDDTPALWTQWEIDRNNIAVVCARFNPQFDRTRFIAATEKE